MQSALLGDNEMIHTTTLKVDGRGPRTRSRQRLLEQLRAHAYRFREEPFTLKSGRTSQHYVDCRRVLLHHSALLQTVSVMCDILDAEHDLSTVLGEVGGGCYTPNVIAGVLSGAGALACMLASPVWGLNAESAWVRPEPKGHGSGNQVELSFVTLRATHPQKVLVVEDVTTTGASALSAVRALRECTSSQAPLVIDRVITLVDREEGAAELFQREGIPFHRVFTLKELAQTSNTEESEGSKSV